jgi:hypothetical protein
VTYETVAIYDDYLAAQQAVDYLADARFPVEHTAIVGTGLRLVENVLDRFTVGRAALAGAASGAWLGLLVGLLFGLFTPSAWSVVLLVGALGGALWGAVLGAVGHAFTHRRRDFRSLRMLAASRYAVTVDAEFAGQALHLLSQMARRDRRPGSTRRR